MPRLFVSFILLISLSPLLSMATETNDCEAQFERAVYPTFTEADIKKNGVGDLGEQMLIILEEAKAHLEEGRFVKNALELLGKPPKEEQFVEYKIKDLHKLEIEKLIVVEKLIGLHTKRLSERKSDESWVKRLSYALVLAMDVSLSFSRTDGLGWSHLGGSISSLEKSMHLSLDIVNYREFHNQNFRDLMNLDERLRVQPYLGELTAQDFNAAILQGVMYLGIAFKPVLADGHYMGPAQFFRHDVVHARENSRKFGDESDVYSLLEKHRKALSINYQKYFSNNRELEPAVNEFMFWILHEGPGRFYKVAWNIQRNNDRLPSDLVESFVRYCHYNLKTTITPETVQLIYSTYKDILK